MGRPKKLDGEQREQVLEWREMGLSYAAIKALVDDAYGIDVDESTIYRYCKEDTNAA